MSFSGQGKSSLVTSFREAIEGIFYVSRPVAHIYKSYGRTMADCSEPVPPPAPPLLPSTKSKIFCLYYKLYMSRDMR